MTPLTTGQPPATAPGMRLRLRQFRPRTGPYEHRVVQPLRPLRHTSLRDPEPYGLPHHSHGLRPGQWPGLRRRLGRGTELTVGTDEARTARDAAAWRERRGHAENRDDLRHLVHACTYFLIGSRDVFAEAAMAFADAAGWGPRQRGVTQGRAALVTDVPGLRDQEPHGWWYGSSCVGVYFKPYPPYAHFRRPGR